MPARRAAVGGVAHDRVADGLQVHPDLVGAAGLEAALEQRHVGLAVRPRRPRRRCARRARPRAPPSAWVGAPTARSARRSRPRASRGRPTPARRSGARRRGRRASRRGPSYAGCVRATTSSPLVSRSRRCTMPGPGGSPTPAISGYRASRPFTSVPSGWPAPGCTTRPAGLATTTTSSSSCRTTTSTPASGAGSPATSGSASSSTTLAGLELAALGHASPSTSTAPASTRSCTSRRVQPVSSATARSRRSPASASGTASSLTHRTAHPRRRVPRAARACRPGPPTHTMRIAPMVMAESATLNVGKSLDVHEVDDRALEEPGRAEQPVDQVAERAAEHQRQAHHHQRVARPAHGAHEDHRHDDGDDGEQRRERLEQAERAAGVAHQPNPTSPNSRTGSSGSSRTAHPC